MVGRADHVKVQVQRNFVFVSFWQSFDVVGRSNQARLFCAPQCKAYFVGGFDIGHLFGYFQYRRAARTVVLNAAASIHRVKVRTHHHHVVSIAAFGLGNHIAGSGCATQCAGADAEYQAWYGGEFLAHSQFNASHWNIQAKFCAQGAIELTRCIVVDHHCRCASRFCIGSLGRKGARTAADQRNVAGCEACKVRGIATSDRRQGADRRRDAAAA